MQSSSDSVEKSVDCRLQANSGSRVRAVRERNHDRHLPRPRGPRIHARPQHGGVRTHWPQHEGSYLLSPAIKVCIEEAEKERGDTGN